MTQRQGNVFVAAFMTVTIGMMIVGPILAYLYDPTWLLLCAAIIFYL